MKTTLISLAIVAMVFGGFAANSNAAEVRSTTVSYVAASTNWDKILDEYEKYVDQYIKVYKKAMNGDMSAMTEYVKLAEKAQKLSEKIEKAEDEMTEAQLKRYTKILMKMTNAMSN